MDTETEYGWDMKVRMKVPIFTGALGSTEIARKNWEHFAAGVAISGMGSPYVKAVFFLFFIQIFTF